jgi:hypothetical protein
MFEIIPKAKDSKGEEKRKDGGKGKKQKRGRLTYSVLKLQRSLYVEVFSTFK